jgi:hypothetical protein
MNAWNALCLAAAQVTFAGAACAADNSGKTTGERKMTDTPGMSRGSVVEDRKDKQLPYDIKGPSTSGDASGGKSKGGSDSTSKCSKHMAC